MAAMPGSAWLATVHTAEQRWPGMGSRARWPAEKHSCARPSCGCACESGTSNALRPKSRLPRADAGEAPQRRAASAATTSGSGVALAALGAQLGHGVAAGEAADTLAAQQLDATFSRACKRRRTVPIGHQPAQVLPSDSNGSGTREPADCWWRA